VSGLSAATVTGLLGGRLSDRIGRKKVVYVANTVIALAAIAICLSQSLWYVFTIAVIFGLGYGAYYSVDWALGCDVLPDKENAAKDMGIWHISMVLPQSLALPLSGWLLSRFGQTAAGHYSLTGFTALFSLAAFFLLLGAVLLRNVKGAR
jgi:MFS family permease